MKTVQLKFIALAILCSITMSQTWGQMADEKCKFLGNVIAGSTPASFTTYWNQVTPENSGKWGSVEATRDVMNWGQLDIAYNAAKNNGFQFKQHTFVWGQQQPAWVAELMANTSIPLEERYEEVRDEVEEWIQLYCERYPQTDFIDVVNEPFHATPAYDLALGSGWNWVIWAFQKARVHCPNAKLILNDYNIINIDAATNDYLALINLLKAQNLIDGIGVQCHRFEIENVSTAILDNNLDKLAETDLPLYITEFDIGNLNNTSTGNSATDDAQQLEIYQRVFPVLWAHPAVEGVTIWGYIQGQTWQSTAYLVRSDGSERPALAWLKNYMLTAPGGSFCLTTGIDETESFLDVYPNPASNGKITLKPKTPNTSVTIRDSFGRYIQTIADIENEIQLELTRGVYIMEIRQNQKITYKKVLIQ